MQATSPLPFCYDLSAFAWSIPTQTHDQAKRIHRSKIIEKLHYIMGDKAVRLTVDADGIIQDAERLDLQSGTFVRDYKTALRVADHVEADKVEAWQIAQLCS